MEQEGTAHQQLQRLIRYFDVSELTLDRGAVVHVRREFLPEWFTISQDCQEIEIYWHLSGPAYNELR